MKVRHITTLVAGIVSAGALVLVAQPLSAQSSRMAQRAIKPVEPAEAPHNPDVLPQNVTFGQLIAAINSQPTHINRLKGMTDLQASGVRLVNVQGLMTGNNAQALQTALDRNQHSVTDMRAAIDASTVIMALLRERSLTAANVVAVDIAANGTVWVFFRQG